MPSKGSLPAVEGCLSRGSTFSSSHGCHNQEGCASLALCTSICLHEICWLLCWKGICLFVLCAPSKRDHVLFQNMQHQSDLRALTVESRKTRAVRLACPLHPKASSSLSTAVPATYLASKGLLLSFYCCRHFFSIQRHPPPFVQLYPPFVCHSKASSSFCTAVPALFCNQKPPSPCITLYLPKHAAEAAQL